MSTTNNWNPDTYNKHASFVSTLGMDVFNLLAPQKDEDILDVGCGEGTLALKMQEKGAKVIGVDVSNQMLDTSRRKGIDARYMSVEALAFTEQFDAVFSNATLHWIINPEIAIKNIYAVLKEEGRFVSEFGGYQNLDILLTVMQEVFNEHKEYGEFINPWYFPRDDEYKALLEKAGFKVEYIELIKRDTPIDDIGKWIEIFANGIIKSLTSQQKKECIDLIKERVKDKYVHKQGNVILDYVRIRLKAVKTAV